MERKQSSPLPFEPTREQLRKLPDGVALTFRETLQRTKAGRAYRVWVAEYYDKEKKRYVYIGSKRMEELKGYLLNQFEKHPRERVIFEQLDVGGMASDNAGTVIKHGTLEEDMPKAWKRYAYKRFPRINRWHILSSIVISTLTDGSDTKTIVEHLQKYKKKYRTVYFYGRDWHVDQLTEEALQHFLSLHKEDGFIDIDRESFEKVESDLYHEVLDGPAPVSVNDSIIFSCYQNQPSDAYHHLLLGLDPETENTFMPLMWFWGLKLNHSLVTARKENADSEIAYAVLEAGGNYCFEVGEGVLYDEVKSYFRRHIRKAGKAIQFDALDEEKMAREYWLLPANKFKKENLTAWPGLVGGTIVVLASTKHARKDEETTYQYFLSSLGFGDEKTEKALESSLRSTVYTEEPSPFFYDISCESTYLQCRDPARIAFEVKLELLRKELGEQFKFTLGMKGFGYSDTPRAMITFERKIRPE